MTANGDVADKYIGSLSVSQILNDRNASFCRWEVMRKIVTPNFQVQSLKPTKKNSIQNNK